jgi:SnoaL-like polyketide cyclase
MSRDHGNDCTPCRPGARVVRRDDTGTLVTPLGEIPVTHRRLSLAGMDIFTIARDVVTEVWAIADYLDLCIQAEAVARP